MEKPIRMGLFFPPASRFALHAGVHVKRRKRTTMMELRSARCVLILDTRRGSRLSFTLKSLVVYVNRRDGYSTTCSLESAWEESRQESNSCGQGRAAARTGRNGPPLPGVWVVE